MPVEAATKDAYRARLMERAAGRPTSRIVGYREFYGRRFSVDANVLSPRPETEILVDLGLEFLRAFEKSGRGRARVLEIGVGSGCVIGSLAAEAPEHDYFGGDVSEAALAVAKRNVAAVAPKVAVSLRRGDLFAPFEGDAPFDLVVSNPPYVSDDEWPGLAKEVSEHDPELALRSGADPTAMLERLAAGAASRTAPDARLALEGGSGLREWRERSAGLAAWRTIRVLDDLAGRPRVVVADGRRE
jgi:release factor glutamine methyltransferase